jgi:PKD repeat protein
VAFDIGNPVIEFSSGVFVSESSKVFGRLTREIPLSPVDYSTGMFVSEITKVFKSPTVDIGSAGILVAFSSGAIVFPPVVAVFGQYTTIIFLSALPSGPLDNTRIVIFGVSVDFSGSPRRGRAPLSVRFTNMCGGSFDRFEWEFGDGGTSLSSDPTHVYERSGIYDVTLRARIEGIWYESVKRRYIHVYEGGLIVSYTNRSFTYAVLPSQGIGFSENTGSWPMPEAGAGPVFYHDDDDQPHLIVMDADDGYEYDILQRDGPEGTGITKKWMDKVGVDGTGGTDVTPLVKFIADVGTFEYFWLKHLVTHIFARSANEDRYRGASGYDSSGFPTGLEFLLRFFVDGERVTEERRVKNIPITGDITTDEDVQGHRIQIELSANMGTHAIVGRKSEYSASDKLDGSGVMTEDDYQEEFSSPVQWFSRGCGSRYSFTDRSTGTELGTVEQAKVTRCEGPDGESESAAQFTEAINFPSVALGGTGTLVLWHQSLTSVTIGGAAVALTQYGTIGSWILSYARNINESGELTITPDGTGRIFDHRIFASNVSDDAIEYYFDNIDEHEGDVMLPWE